MKRIAKALHSNFKLHRSVSTLLATCLLISSCTFKKVDRVGHQGAANTDLVSVDPHLKTSTEIKVLESKIDSLDLSQIKTKIVEMKNDTDALSIIKILEANAINVNVWTTSALKFTDRVIESLDYYNKAVLFMSTKYPAAESTSDLLTNYQKMTLTACDENLENCLNISWLKRDPRSSLVIETIVSRLDKAIPDRCTDVSCENNLKLFYNLMSVAFSIANAQNSVSLKSLYLKRATQYSNLLKADKLNNSGPLSRLGKIFEIIINSQPLDAKDKELEAVVKQFQPWSYSRLNANEFPYGADKIFAFASAHLMYDESGKKLSPELRKAIDESQLDKSESNKNDPSGASFKIKLNSLVLEPDSSSVFTGLQFDISTLRRDEFYNEYFYMIDRFYRDHISLEEVTNIWAGSKKDEKVFVNTLLMYLKVELVRMLVVTNRYFTGILMQKNITNDRLFRKTVDESQPLTQQWDRFYNRIEKLSLFLGQQIKNIEDKGESKSIDELVQTKDLIKGIKRNTKFLSVYPNMLLIGYFMINADAGFKFTTWWGAEITIDPKEIVNYLLDGGFSQPWYMFSGDSGRLTKTGIIYAFYYALNGGAFETFSTIKDDKESSVLTRLSFFQKALKKTIATEKKAVEDAIIEMNQFRKGDPAMSNLVRVCTMENSDNRNYSLAMKLEDLQYFSILGGPTKGLVQVAAKFYDKLDAYYTVSSDNNAKDSGNTLRAILLDRLTQMKAMKVPMIDNINQINATKEEKDRLKSAIDYEIVEIENLLKRYLAESIKLHREIDTCSEKMIWLERGRQGELINAEMAHLNRVFDAMSEIHELPIDKRAEKAKQLHGTLGLGETESITSDSYSYSKFDLLTRFGKWSSALKPSLKIEQPDTTTKDTLSADLRTIQFISGSTGKPLSRLGFLNNGLVQLNGQGSNTIEWLKDIHTLKLFERKMSSLISMYRLGIDLGIEKDPALAISPNEIIQKALAMVKFASIQESEKVWLNMMSQPDIIPKADYRSFIFDQSETEFRGIFDSIYNQATRANGDLSEASRYALESKNLGNLIFPIPDLITKEIDKQYIRLVERTQKIVCDFDKAIINAESTMQKKDLEIVYRIEDGKQFVYSPNLVDGGNTTLLDPRRRQFVSGIMKNFFYNDSSNFYTEAPCN